MQPGYPLDVEALLIVELDGPGGRCSSLDRARRAHRQGLRRDNAYPRRARKRSGCTSGPGARRRFRPSGRISPDYSAWTAPSRAASCPWCWSALRELSEKYGLRVANVFHAGDGNLHPLILYDANKDDELEPPKSSAPTFEALRRGRRRAHRRARRRRREARPDAGDVLRATRRSSSG